MKFEKIEKSGDREREREREGERERVFARFRERLSVCWTESERGCRLSAV